MVRINEILIDHSWLKEMDLGKWQNKAVQTAGFCNAKISTGIDGCVFVPT